MRQGYDEEWYGFPEQERHKRKLKEKLETGKRVFVHAHGSKETCHDGCVNAAMITGMIARPMNEHD